MQERKIPQLAARVVTGVCFAAVLTSAGTTLAAPQGPAASGAVEVRTVSAAVQRCLNLRQSPSYSAPIIGCIEIGSEVTVSGAWQGWSRVSSESEGDGWVGTRFLEPSAAAASAASPAPEPRAEVEPPPATAEPQAATDAGVDRLTGERDQLRERLSSADARIAALEDELAALGSLRGEAATRGQMQAEILELRTRLDEAQSALSERELILATTEGERDSASQLQASLAQQVADLTAERDRLAAALNRAEARQLYLQSDLEQTRAELMRLKGVPARLVVTEPEPPPAVETPADGDTPETTEPAATAALHRAGEVLDVVRAWAQAWSEQRVDDYLAFYSPAFAPADGESRDSWERSRRERVAAARSIEVTLERLSPTISGERAIVLFEQTYASDTFRDVVDKTLVLELHGGAWLILQERADG